mgnify:CR=1 FL=1
MQTQIDSRQALRQLSHRIHLAQCVQEVPDCECEVLHGAEPTHVQDDGLCEDVPPCCC